MPSSLQDGSFVESTITRSATENIRAHGQINLTDNTAPAEEAEDSEIEGSSSVRRTYSRLIRDNYTDFKYRKYQESRYNGKSRTGPPQSRPAVLARSSTQRTNPSLTPSRLEDLNEGEVAEHTTSDTETREGRLRRGQRRVRRLLHRRRPKDLNEGDTEIDVLYENQRGAFLFGIPHFSSKSLLNFDPVAWLNGDMRPSPVTIVTAQVPDPTWQWEWKNWYVDMSSDVDEDGWQYSFMFQNKFAWHGTHPWFHSFVRRRRWIRKRVRKTAMAPARRQDAGDPMKAGHRLNADYFTIHPARPKSIGSSTAPSSTAYRLPTQLDDFEDDNEDIEDIASLLARLRVAKVDREKINLVLRFMDEGGQDTYYLANEMHHILSMFIFQHSRQRLLELMNRTINAATQHREQHIARDQPEFENEKRKIDNLERARKAADVELQRLEYWSDIKRHVKKGLSSTAVDEAEGWDHGWAGLDRSGPGGADRPVDDTDEVLDNTRRTFETQTAPEEPPKLEEE